MSDQFLADPSSYRDPSGFIFEKDGTIYRQVNKVFQNSFDHFINSGCYKHLSGQGLLIPHEQLTENLTGDQSWYTTLRPERIAFVSYPYEWSFDMLKDAALLTLQLVRETLHYGMILKDATPYNIQWHQGRLTFIDTLSFDKYEETPWIAYRQFCENFLGPLLLMHYSKRPLQQMQLSWPDGIPLETISALLPRRSRYSLYTYLHVHLHAKMSAKKSMKKAVDLSFSKQKLLNLISSLETLVTRLRLPEQDSTWSHYYEEAGQRSNYLEEKKTLVTKWIGQLDTVRTSADLGANEGEFARIAAKQNIQTIAADFDSFCINRLYNSIKKNNEKYLQPCILDLAAPSPSIGLNNEERPAFLRRLHVDLILALAVTHHLAIGRNIPFEKIADLFATCGRHLIIEFIPREDDKLQLLLKDKKDIYTAYNEENFTRAFSRHFNIEAREVIKGSNRVLFKMQKL